MCVELRECGGGETSEARDEVNCFVASQKLLQERETMSSSHTNIHGYDYMHTECIHMAHTQHTLTYIAATV